MVGNQLLLDEFKARGFDTHLAYLKKDRTKINATKGEIIFADQKLVLSEVDVAYFRTWGNKESPSLAHQWQPILEQEGIQCLDPLFTKLHNYNKHLMMK